MKRVYYCEDCSYKNNKYICNLNCSNYDLKPDLYCLKNGECTTPLYKRNKDNNDPLSCLIKAGQEFKETLGMNDEDIYTLLDKNRSDFDNFSIQYITNIIVPREKIK